MQLVIGFDCEGVDLCRNRTLCTIQMKETDDSDMLTLVIQEMSNEFPTLTETLVHERDQLNSIALNSIYSLIYCSYYYLLITCFPYSLNNASLTFVTPLMFPFSIGVLGGYPGYSSDIGIFCIC